MHLGISRAYSQAYGTKQALSVVIKTPELLSLSNQCNVLQDRAGGHFLYRSHTHANP